MHTSITASATARSVLPVWAHPRCAGLLRDRPGDVLAAALGEAPELAAELGSASVDVVKAPTRLVSDSQVVDLGGRRVELLYLDQ